MNKDNLFSLIHRSAQGLKKVKVLVGTSMFIALNIILGFTKITLIPQVLEIQFSTLAHAACAYIYGPIMAGIAGIFTDTFKYLLNPSGAYMPLFALNEFLTGFIYGCFFYKKKITLTRAALARLVVVLLLNLTLTPLWLHLLYGKAFLFYVQIRIVKNLLMYPIDVFLLYTVLKATQRSIPAQLIKQA